MKYVVAHHAHHPDEGVYRLVFGEAHEVTEQIEEDNSRFDTSDEVLDRMGDPDFDPIVLQPTIIREVTRTVLMHLQEVVWDHEDERWDGLSVEQIAVEQRRDVKEAIDRRVALAERQQAEEAQRRVIEFDGAGTEL